MRVNHQLIHILQTIEDGLIRHFSNDWLVINGCATHVDDIVEQLQRHIAHIERTDEAFAIWLDEASALRDALRYEVRPLLAGVRSFVAEELGFDSPRLRDFGFTPGAAIAPDREA
jgi:hypothetical protein